MLQAGDSTADAIAAAPAPARGRGSRGFADGYAARTPGHDEMVEPDGSLRPHWRMFVNMLDDLGRDELLRRWDQARRLIHENGVTHNVYGDPNGLDRPWSLDFVPLLIPAAEWRAVSAGLVQRAKLLDALMDDLYGQGRVLGEGLLPAELIFANPAFLRPCHGLPRPPGEGHRLHLYAADLARTPDGQFHVLVDRTQAPSGAGYTLENRIVLSRALPSVFRQCNVHRLAPFFIALRQTLAAIAPPNRENPRVVLLTPGPYNETYFEHAYLARYLGYGLVQGNDLTVRDARVFLKTLSGLQRVDVILRRVDDDFCDPLELYPHSFLGVPGLMEAVRAGNVTVANGLGSGVLQTPAFLPYLAGICRALLGEELMLPSVQTWWCGEPAALSHVLGNLGRLVVKPAFPTRSTEPVFGRTLSRNELEQLAGRIAARPVDFVAQEEMISCSAPGLLDGQVQPRRFVVRSFLVSNTGSYAVMAGGLTRITPSPDALLVSLQRGGGSKDTWVLADGPVNEPTLLAPASQAAELSRGGGALPSRIADDLFWLGRYVQRAEGIVRTARCLLGRLSDQSGLEVPGTVAALMRCLSGDESDAPAAAADPAKAAAAAVAAAIPGATERRIIAAVFGSERTRGLRATIRSVHKLTRVLRDRISADAWRILQGIELDVSDYDFSRRGDGRAGESDDGDGDGGTGDNRVGGLVELFNKLITGFAAFVGLAADSMTRGQSWRFLDLGHRIERALAVTHLVRDALVTVVPDESPVLDAVLEVGDSSLTYRRRYLTQLEAPAVVDLLVADDTNPRAVAFQVAAIEEHLQDLPREQSHPLRCPDLQMVLKLRTMLRLVDLQTACTVSHGRRARLDDLLGEVVRNLASISECVSQTYFSHATVARHLLSRGPEPLP